jgi:hypothetical protein
VKANLKQIASEESPFVLGTQKTLLAALCLQRITLIERSGEERFTLAPKKILALFGVLPTFQLHANQASDDHNPRQALDDLF